MIIANDGRTAQGEALPKNHRFITGALRPLQAQHARLAFHSAHTGRAKNPDLVSLHTVALLCEWKGAQARAAACVMAVWPITFAIEHEAVEVAHASEAK